MRPSLLKPLLLSLGACARKLQAGHLRVGVVAGPEEDVAKASAEVQQFVKAYQSEEVFAAARKVLGAAVVKGW